MCANRSQRMMWRKISDKMKLITVNILGLIVLASLAFTAASIPTYYDLIPIGAIALISYQFIKYNNRQ